MATVVETMRGPYNLAYVAFYAPEKPVQGPLHVVFQLSKTEDARRFIDVMDNEYQTVMHGIQTRPPGGGSGHTRREAAQWMLDMAGARYGQAVSALDAWI